MRFAFVAIVVAACLLLGCGCSAWTSRPPIEAFAGKFADEVVIPAVKQGLSQGVEHLTIQAGAQGINPTYVVRFSGKWVVGLEATASVGVEGVAGQMQVSSGAAESPQ